VILPFEKEFYAKWNFEVEYVGHPLVEVIDDFKKEKDKTPLPMVHEEKTTTSKTIALLPGSREQEILKKLPIMLQVARHFPDYKFVVAKAPGLTDDFYAALLAPYTNVDAVLNKTYQLLSESAAAIVTSGTATLETALFNVPEVICYKSNNFSYQIAKRIIKIKYICLVNLIMDREVVKELIQDELTVENLVTELNKLLLNKEKRLRLQEDYAALKELLSEGGHASANAAKSIYSIFNA
jgi:lipid-A-disaccharide synthase